MGKYASPTNKTKLNIIKIKCKMYDFYAIISNKYECNKKYPAITIRNIYVNFESTFDYRNNFIIFIIFFIHLTNFYYIKGP